MNHPPLTKGNLVKRYKRFLADIVLQNGEIVTAHCPNPGSMQSCSKAGRPVLLSKHESPKRKLAYTWELYRAPHSWVNVNTLRTNAIVAEAVKTGRIPSLTGYGFLQREVTVGDSRIDLFLSGIRGDCYVEVKSVTLALKSVAMFPDAVTLRGRKHLRCLQQLTRAGARAAMLFLVQRGDVASFRPAHHIDPHYAETLQQAALNGVEILVYQTHITTKQTTVVRSLPYNLSSDA
ncbi:DNA/RNA nuclease SfsA [candidate division KSB1 bacterium]|nr:DNA/RNA nuclease SfsA [candidate division KSB1 bacterium]